MAKYEAIKVLENLNNWCTGAEIPQPDPKTITQAINVEIKELKQNG